MKIRELIISVFLATAFLVSFFGIASGFGPDPQGQPVRVILDANKTGEPISKYLYGQFLEHIGGIINNGLWAEMLEDRKFYYPITSNPPAGNRNSGQTPGRARGAMRRWTPIGPPEGVVMDTHRPYTGEHSPLVKLSRTERRGIRQAGLTLIQGKTYTGRVVLAGIPALRCP